MSDPITLLDLRENPRARIDSPRSLKACAKEGILVDELVQK